MHVKVSDSQVLYRMVEENTLFGQIELDNSEFYFDRPLLLKQPVNIEGNGALITGPSAAGIIVASGDVTLNNIRFSDMPNAITVDARGKTISNIFISHIYVRDPGYGMVFNIGSTENDSRIENLHFEDCEIRSTYDEKAFLEKGMLDGATAFMIAAASPTAARREDICRCSIDGLFIERCSAYGGRRYGINMLAGIILPTEGYDFASQKASVIDCTIKNVKILDCILDYCREMAITLSCGTLRNFGSLFENLEVARCKVVFGICGIGYSAAGPIIPTSVSRNMGVRHGSIHDNYLIEMDLPVNEPNMALGLCGGRAEGFKGVECYDCFVEDIQFYGNTVENAMIGFFMTAANTLTDEFCILKGNYLKDIDVWDNTFINCEKAFFLTGAYGEGRRFDYDWGWYHKDQNWAPLAESDTESSVEFIGNYIANTRIHDNTIKGCRYEIEATGVSSRGHALVKDNKLINIEYRNNVFTRSEGHKIVMPVYSHDWVKDAGGNETVMDLLNKK